jgi:ATP-dependent Lhr-like helicase
MKTTRILDDRVVRAIGKRGFDDLSEVQEAAIPPICAGRHVLIIAPTGTGKTESAMLPVFHSLLALSGPGFKALYITPLRSLNRDMLARLQWWCRELGISVGVRHGDTPQSVRRKQALNPPDLLITTPETLQALFMGSRLREHLRNVRHVIIDEIHDLAPNKRGAQLSLALERLAEYAGEFQRIALSATVGNPDIVGEFLCGNRPFETVHIPVAPSLDISVRYGGGDFQKQADFISRCLDREPSNLLFVNTRATAEALGHALFERGDIEVHHGSLSKEVRIDAEERFKRNELRTLICTSSMELGIDIGHVEHVLQFGSPREVARLVQRVGRAGHSLNAVSRGTIVTTGFDDLLESLVITRRSKANMCENIRLQKNAADVLANQIAAIALEYGNISLSRLREMIERSSCFSECGELIAAVCQQMARHRLIWFENDSVSRSGRSRLYLSSNLSMIHDERKVSVVDIVSRRTVGSLDESFVVTWLHTGITFITKGQLWRVLEMADGRILVEPARHSRGEIPTWEGEQIPVPFDIAQEVGSLRRSRDPTPYAVTPRSAGVISAMFHSMDEHSWPVPHDRRITIESMEDGVVLNICAGHRVNETIARMLSILLAARYGSSVGMEVGAYRIFLRLPVGIHAEDVASMLESLKPEHIRGILTLALKRTALFKWKLVQVAKKFGAIDADADFEKISIHRLIDLFDGTIIQDEAYRELFANYLDVEGAQEVIGGICRGAIAVQTGRLSVLGSEGLFSSRDMIAPPTIDQAVIATIKKRLERDSVILFCMHCRAWKRKTTVARVPDKPQCPQCGARLIAALKPWEDECIPQVKKSKKSPEERDVELRMLRNANIVLSSGKAAVIALAARGVGPEIASRILARMQEGDAFYREILNAERNYIRTHRFW